MPRSRNYRSVGGGSTSSKSSLGSSEGDDDTKPPGIRTGTLTHTEVTMEEQKETSGFTFMGLVFFGSDSEEDVEVTQSSSSSKSRQKVIDLAKLRKKKEPTSRYQLHESDDNSEGTAETSETALFRYLFEQGQKALPVSDPEKIIQESDGRLKHGTSKGGRWMKHIKQKDKVRASKGNSCYNSAFNQPKSVIPQLLPKKAVAHPWKKSDTYVAPRAVFAKSKPDDSKGQDPIQRILPFQEKKQPDAELLPGGFTGQEILYEEEEEKPTKACKLWPSSKHRKAIGASTYDDDDDDSFLQFREDDRQPSENDKRDVMERMDSLEDGIRGSKPKSCLFLLPKREGRGESAHGDEDEIGKEDSFTDLVEEHKKKRNFFPYWPSSNAETQESLAGNTESSNENSREQPEEAFQFQPQKVFQYDRRSAGRTLADSLKEQKIKNCWPAKSQQRRLGDKFQGTPKAYTRVASPTESNTGPSRRIDTIDESKRCFPALFQHAPEDEHHAVVTAADDIIDIIEKQDAERRRQKAVAVYEPKSSQWRQFGGFGIDRPSYQDQDDDHSLDSRDQSLESRDQDWSVAASSVVESNRFTAASMHPLLDDELSAGDPSVDDADSFDSGWFTLESLVA